MTGFGTDDYRNAQREMIRALEGHKDIVDRFLSPVRVAPLHWINLKSGREHFMKATLKKAAILVLAVVTMASFVVATADSAMAKQPPGQQGYEGQPGNQGGHGGNGPNGYEGQPGNQSHNN